MKILECPSELMMWNFTLVDYLDWSLREVNGVGKVQDCFGTNGLYWNYEFLSLSDANQVMRVILAIGVKHNMPWNAV